MIEEDQEGGEHQEADVSAALSEQEREERLVRAVGESLGMDIGPEQALAQLDRQGRARAREERKKEWASMDWEKVASLCPTLRRTMSLQKLAKGG